MEDGTDMDQKNTKSLKVDISSYVKKYMIPPPKFMSLIPQSHLDIQSKFYRRSFIELLDRCSYSIFRSAKDLQLSDMFRVMWTPQGKKIELME